MPNTNLENAKTNMKSRIRNRAAISTTPRDLGRLAKSARFVGLIDDSDVETELNTQMAAAIPSASIDDLVELSEGINELRDRRPALGGLTSTDQMVEGTRKFLHANSVQPAISVSGDLSYENGVISYTTPTSAALQVVATVGDLPAGASAGDQAVVQSNNKLYIKTADGWYAVALINTAPSVSGNDASYTLATDGTPTVITLTATDPENDPVSFSYSVTAGALNGTTVQQADNVFTITPHGVLASSFELTFSADDSVNVATAVSSFSLVFIPERDFTNSIANARRFHTPEGNDDRFGNGMMAYGNKVLVRGERWGNHPNNHWVGLFDITNVSSYAAGSVTNANVLMVWAKKNGDVVYNGGISGATTDNYAFWSYNVGAHQMNDTYYALRNYLGHTDHGWVRIYNVSDGQLHREIQVQGGGGGLFNGSDAGVSPMMSIVGDSIFVGTGFQRSHKGGPVMEYSISTGQLLGTFDYPGAYTNTVGGSHPRGYGFQLDANESIVVVSATGDTVDGSVPSGNGDDQVGRVYIFDRATRNSIAAINDPRAASHSRRNTFGGRSNDWCCIALSGDYLAIGCPEVDNDGYGVLYIYDVSNPSSPSLLHTIDHNTIPGTPNNAEIGKGLSVQGKYVSFVGGTIRQVVVVNMETGNVELNTQGDTTYHSGNAGFLIDDALITVDNWNRPVSGRQGSFYVYPTE